MLSPTRPLRPSERSGPDLSSFLPSMLRCGCTPAPTDSFGGSVEETESSAPGGPAGDLLGGETLSTTLDFCIRQDLVSLKGVGLAGKLCECFMLMEKLAAAVMMHFPTY